MLQLPAAGRCAGCRALQLPAHHRLIPRAAASAATGGTPAARPSAKPASGATASKTPPAPAAEADGVVRNAAGVQMLDQRLWTHVFGQQFGKRRPVDSGAQRRSIEQMLRQFDLYGKSAPPIDTSAVQQLQLPPLQGADIAQHFAAIGKEQAQPYQQLLAQLIQLAQPASFDVRHNRPSTYTTPPQPQRWSTAAGWTHYTPEGPRPVPAPLDQVLVFDVEVLVRKSPFAVMATALGPSGWYSWVSPQYHDPSAPPVLIPLYPV